MIGIGEFLGRLALAALLASAIGCERTRLERAAGLRTHALVGVGACLFMLVSEFGFRDVRGISGVVLDPSRVAAQVVSGIGFLGAGTIILHREVVKGLTTAASVWAVAALGLSVGGGLYAPAVFATCLMLLILAGAKPLERRLRPPPVHTVQLTIDQNTVSFRALRSAVERAGYSMEHVRLQAGESPDDECVDLVVRSLKSDGNNKLNLLESLRALKGVHKINADVAPSSAGGEDLDDTDLLLDDSYSQRRAGRDQ